MYALLQLLGQGPIHFPLALDAIHSGKDGRNDTQLEMRLAAFAGTRMPGMAGAVVFDLQSDGRERRDQLRPHAIFNLSRTIHAKTAEKERSLVCQAFRFLVF